jgi:glucose-specific phosphotransferase system IIA component
MKLNQIFTTLQKVGQSLMIPVSVLPAAGLLVALGRVLKDSNGNETLLGKILFSGGLAIFEQLSVIFAIGVAIGFTGGAGVAGLAAAAGYFTMVNILKVASDAQKLELAINTGVFGGILIGLVTAAIYNRYHQIKLPPIFGFFSGKRFIPIVSVAAAFGVAIILSYTWPPIQAGIHAFGNSMMGNDWGPAFYAAGKRLLIPVGLHHVYYPPFLFQFGEFTTAAGQILHGESARYFGGDPTAGRFMASEYPLMLFGLPAAALAMVLAAPKPKRKAVAGVMLSAALTSIITGITEPIEFAFIFVAPLLYVLHVVFAFGAGLLTNYFDVHLGYTFSASAIDFALGFFNQKNSMILFTVIGPIIGLTYFTSFYFLIKMFKFQTPGREVERSEDNSDLENGSASKGPTTQTQKARQVLAALGGKSNIDGLDACITRLRLNVKNPDLVQTEQFKKLGAAGVMKSGSNFQIIFGVESDLLKEEMKRLMKKTTLGAPSNGTIVPLSEVPDKTFADKYLGDGFAIDASAGALFAPIAGKIVTVFPTNHALGMETEEGLELLVHIGIDTVQMKGNGFKSFVKVGDIVKAGDRLLEYDLGLVKTQAKSNFSPIIITNMDKVKSMKIIASGTVKNQEPVLELELQ